MFMDIKKIRNFLPHRYPMLLVDRVLESTPNSLVGIKNVTVNEPFFNGHFPQQPVMPGVLILESMAQACGLLAFSTAEGELVGDNIFYLVGIENARFKRPVGPGDQLRLEAHHKRTIRGLWLFDARATVDGALVAEAEIRCTMREVTSD
jgi:3-hydroxyacyl-[acyl-carrier-protein] dehydratase